MSKRLILVLTLAFVVGIAFAAYAEVQNVKVSGDILVEGLLRNNLTLRKQNRAPAKYVEFDPRISGILSHLRLRIDADLTDDVSATVRLLNERVWGQEDNAVNDTDIDLDLAYVTLKDVLKVIAQSDIPLTLVIGRQELMFGNGLIIGDVDTNGIMAGHNAGGATSAAALTLPNSLDDLSLRKAFDAVRATLAFNSLTLDALYSKVDENVIDAKDDVNLYGVNANYSLDKNTTLEGYYWEKQRKKANAALAEGAQRDGRADTTRTLGARAQYTGVKNLLVGLEGAFQFGNHIRSTTLYPDEGVNDGTARRREGYALQAVAQFNLADLIKQFEPMISGSYTYLSGDKQGSNSERYKGWDPMYENQAGGTLYNKILGYSNAQLYNVTGSWKPLEDLKWSLAYNYLRLNKAYPAASSVTYNLTGVAGDPTYYMTDKKTLGHEIDTVLTYDYTEDVQLGLNLGWFFPGNAFNKDVNNARNNRETATQVIGSMKVTF